MSAEIDITVVANPVRVLPVLATAVDVVLLTGDGNLNGFSLRDATADIPVDNEGSVTSPAAGATITSLAGVPGGTYQVNWTVELAGTVAAIDSNNFTVSDPAGVVETSINAGAVGVYPQIPFEVTVPSSGTWAVKALAIGTVGAIYSASFSLTPVQVANTLVELQDGNNPLAEISLGALVADSRWYGNQGLKIRNTIKLHVISGAVAGAIYASYNDLT